MKITALHTVAVGAEWRNYLFVRVETDEGLVGIGEASLAGQTHAVMGAIRDFEPLFLGADPLRIEHLWQQAYRHAFWHGGVTLLSALAGIEVALWDIRARSLDVPIYTLFGGPVRDRIRAYANGPRGNTPDELARSAASLVDLGYTAMKMTPFDAMPMLSGKRLIDQGVEKVRAVRDAIGPDVELMLDAHGRLSPSVSIRAAERLQEFGIMFLEEPCLPEHAPAMIRIAEKSPIPIATGERLYTRWDMPELLASRRIGVLQPDIIQSGGLAEARKIAAMAESYFVAVAPHNPWSWVNTMASFHLDAVLPNFLIQEVVADREPWKEACVIDHPVMDADGFFPLPKGPGLGIELDLEGAKKFPPVEGRPIPFWHEDGSVADW